MKSSILRYLSPALLFLLVLSQSGCDDDHAAGPGEQPPPASSNATPTEVGAPNGTATSATIGAAGGTLTTPDGKTTLTVPAGALGATTTITLQPLVNKAHGGIGAAFRLTPEGQTFAKPVQLKFSYADADLKGTAAAALGIAFQRSTGVWEWVDNPVLDTVAKTVTVQTTHFSDWSLVSGFQIFPHEATVATGKTVALKVVYCYSPSVQPGDVALGYACLQDDPPNAIALDLMGHVSEWSVNGVAGGNGTTGTVTSGSQDFNATYTAPATKPNPATVAVSARVKNRNDANLVLVVSNITITESADYTGTVQFDTAFATGTANVSWKKFEDEAGVRRFLPSGTLNVNIHAQGCDPVQQTLPIATSSPDSPVHTMVLHTAANPAYPKQYYFALAGAGNVTLQCGTPRVAVTVPASSVTQVYAGPCTAGAPMPAYTDEALLAGSVSCPEQGLSNATWSFAGQQP